MTSTARAVHELLVARGETVAVAESLTGGLTSAELTATAGASASFRGGLVVYATDLKAALAEVPQELLERHGAVHPDVAAALAAGVRRRLGASWGLGLTGVAGPDPQDGQPVGTVHIGVAAPLGEPARPIQSACRGSRRDSGGRGRRRFVHVVGQPAWARVT